MVAGDAVLLHRILAVVPFYWKRRIKFVHVLVLLARVISGVVDVARVHISFNVNTGSCDYRDSHIVSTDHVREKTGYSTHIYELGRHLLHHFRYSNRLLCDMRYLSSTDSTYAETESGWTRYC